LLAGTRRLPGAINARADVLVKQGSWMLSSRSDSLIAALSRRLRRDESAFSDITIFI
jgi:hypothetical protein